ncbi:hypothetical protein ACJX0J_029274 [Zea mays]
MGHMLRLVLIIFYNLCSMFCHILLGLNTVQPVSDFIENNVFVLGSIATLEVGLISIVETFLLLIATLRITSLNLFYFISIHVSLLFSAAQIKSTLIEYILFLWSDLLMGICEATIDPAIITYYFFFLFMWLQ